MKQVFVGIDFGGTRIKIALIFEDVIVADKNIEAASELSFEERLSDITLEIKDLLSGTDFSISGIGFAFPGIVNFYTSQILSKYVKYSGAEKIDLNAWAMANFNVPLVIENDARAALIGEWKYGAGIGSSDLVLVTLGTGVGTGVLLNGTPLRGKNFIAGNLGGHTTINFEGNICNCGNIGCVESESSTWVLTEIARKSPQFLSSKLSQIEVIDFKSLFQLSEEQDPLAIELKNRCLKVWALCVINLVHAYDPEKIIFGGGVMKSSHIILPYIKEMIDKHAWINSTDVELVEAFQLENAGILGLYILFKQKYQ